MLIKQVQAGDTSKLEGIKKAKRENDYFFPMFYYLCKHGRIVKPQVPGNPVLCLADLPDLKMIEDKSKIAALSFETLIKALEVFDSIEFLYQSGTLKNLTPDNDSKIKPISQMKGEGFMIAGEDLKGNAIVFVEADRLTDEQIENYKNS